MDVIFQSYDCADFFRPSFKATLWRYGHSNPDTSRIVYFSEQDDEGEALTALKTSFSEAFGTGYPLPLLSRWKHYGPALAYMTVGVLLYGFLHEVIRIMSHEEEASGQARAASGQGAAASGQDADLDAEAREHEERLELVHAQDNKVRMEKFCAFLRRASSANFRMLSLCVNPLSRCVDQLLLRSTRLQEVRLSLVVRDKLPALKSKLRSEFLHMVNGGFGSELTRCYAQLLNSTPAQLARSRGIEVSEAAALLPLLVAICSDIFKRSALSSTGGRGFAGPAQGDTALDRQRWQDLRRKAEAHSTCRNTHAQLRSSCCSSVFSSVMPRDMSTTWGRRQAGEQVDAWAALNGVVLVKFPGLLRQLCGLGVHQGSVRVCRCRGRGGSARRRIESLRHRQHALE